MIFLGFVYGGEREQVHPSMEGLGAMVLNQGQFCTQETFESVLGHLGWSQLSGG